MPNPLDALAVLAVIAAAWAAEAGYQGWTFAAASLGMASVMGSLLFDLAPRVFVSSTNTAYNLTIANSAAGSYSLQVMTVVAVVFFPLVLALPGLDLPCLQGPAAVPGQLNHLGPNGTNPPVGPGGDVTTPEGDRRRRNNVIRCG